jgi:excisionase family DNA binding protein
VQGALVAPNMNAPLRLSDLVPGLVIAGGRRTVTETEIRDFADRFGPALDEGRSAPPAPRGKASADTASGWLICAIAQQLAATAVATNCRSTGALRVEKLSWPSAAHAGDDLELKIEILEKHASRSGTCGFVRWHWMLAVSNGNRVLDLVSGTLLEDRGVGEKKTVAAGGAIAYKVSTAASMVGISRYLLYEAIRDQELRAYRPRARSDLMILAEDLREWVTRYPVRPKNSR